MPLPRKIVLRKDWGARRPKATTSRLKSVVDTVFYHYTASTAPESHAQCDDAWRSIQNYHMDHNGWNDVAYSWGVCKHGYIFRLRGWAVVPGATLNHNTHSVAICFLGTDRVGRDDVTELGRKALVDATAMAFNYFGRELLRRAHNDVNPTVCPGPEIEKFVKSANFLERVRYEQRFQRQR